MTAVRWYVARNGQKVGPFSPNELKQLASAGLLRPAEMIWCDGMSKWAEASRLADLFPAAGQKRYWLSLGGKTRGPFGGDQLRAALAAHQVARETLACPEGDTRWVPLAEFTEFRGSVMAAGPSQARLLAGDLDAEQAELYLAGRDGDALAQLISTLIDLKKAHADNAGLVDGLESSIQLLKARREQGAARRAAT